MDIKYYYNCDSRCIEAINMDNVKRIYIEWHGSNNKNLSTLYFDDIKIHSIDKESMEDKINEVVNLEEALCLFLANENLRNFQTCTRIA